MARRKSATVNVEPATAREAREYLLENAADLPEGVNVGSRGRLSTAAKEHFTKVTGRPISE